MNHRQSPGKAIVYRFVLPVVLLMLGFGVASSQSTYAADATLPLKVISHNVWYGFTKKGEPRHGHWVQWMRDQSPDVTSLQELNGYTPERLAEDAANFGHKYSVLLKTDGFPTGVTSKYPITDVKRIREGMHHGMIRCRIEGVWFYIIHFHPSNYQRRIEEAAILKRDIEQLPEENPRIVLAGDFNGFSPRDRGHYESDAKLVPFFQMLDRQNSSARNLNEDRLDYGGLEAIEAMGFVDVVAESRSAGVHKEETPFVGTFPSELVADEDHGTDRRIDYIFVTPNLRKNVRDATILRNSTTELLSDHIPITATIDVTDTRVFESEPELILTTGAGEGPAWDPELGLLTSGEGNINRLDLEGKASVFVEGAGSNGLMFDRSGRLLVCEPVRRCLSRLDDQGGLVVLADRYEGARFNQPNDLTMDSKGRIFFTDPCYGDRSSMEMRDKEGNLVEGVYRVDTDGAIQRVITHEVDRPNGILVTKDDRYLFVADNNNNAVGGARKLWRFEFTKEGDLDLASQRLVYDWGTTRGPDGIKMDSLGRIFVAAGLNLPNLPAESADPPTAGIYVFSPQGRLLDFCPIPKDETTNCAFGGPDLKTLFVTAGGTLWKVRTKEPGAPIWP